MSTDRTSAYALWVGILIFATVLALGIRSTSAITSDTSWVDHTHRVIEAIDKLALSLSRVVIARRGYALTGDEAESVTFTRAIATVRDSMRQLRELTLDNSRQQSRLDVLAPFVDSYLVHREAAFQYRREHGFDAAHETEVVRGGTAAYLELSARADELVEEERRLLVIRVQRTDRNVTTSRTLELVGACVGVLLIGIALVRLRRESRRRERSEQVIVELNHDLERRIVVRTEQLTAANAELEAFSYALIHDLRAPLRGMSSFADVLLDDHRSALDLDVRECLSEVQTNARKMALLIDALDALSRITRGDLQRSDVDLTTMVHSSAAELGVGGETVELAVHDGLRVEADAALARMLVDALLGNSYKFANRTARARIEAGEALIEGERVLFVRDNGAGFDMAHYAKLFKPFGRLHTIAEFSGVGMGLAVAHRIVRRHGGRIWADGNVGRGATFYFTLSPPGRA